MNRIPEQAIRGLYNSYIMGNSDFITAQEDDVTRISKALDDKVAAGAVTNADLSEYEEAARRAGFYAGVQAVASINGLTI